MWCEKITQSVGETFKLQFAQDETNIDTTHLTEMQIDTDDSEHVLQRPYPIAMKYCGWVRNEINKLLDVHVIHSSHSIGQHLSLCYPRVKAENA